MRLGAYLRERLNRPIRLQVTHITKLEAVILAIAFGALIASTVRGLVAILQDVLWALERLGS